MTDLVTALRDFNKDRKFSRKGPLCVALVVTQQARKMGLPLNPDKLLTKAGGQVLGLAKGAVQAVLNRHGITRVLAAEGGRISRGSISNMRESVDFFNSIADAVDLDAVETFWIERLREFFSAKPFKIHLDASRSLRTLVRDVIAQAEERQRNTPGMQYAGAVLQHLVGDRLDCALGVGNFKRNSFSTSDAQTGRAGDFFIGFFHWGCGCPRHHGTGRSRHWPLPRKHRQRPSANHRHDSPRSVGRRRSGRKCGLGRPHRRFRG